jgi:hypothetical protein
MPIPEELSDEAVDTLWVLWKERKGKKFADEGLTVEQISTATRIPLQRIYNAIDELGTRGDKWNTIMQLKNKRPGKKARCYKLYTDNVPDWPRAPFLLFELDNFDKNHNRQIDAGEFCAHLLNNCAYRHQDDLDEIIRGLCAMDYLYRSPAHPVLAQENKPGYLILSLGERYRSELEFLDRIARRYPTSEDLVKQGRKIKSSHYLEDIRYYTNPPELD